MVLRLRLQTNLTVMTHSPDLISEIVRSEARRPTTWSYVDVSGKSLFGQIVTSLISRAAADIQIISVDDTYMEIASYADLNPPIVLLGTSHFRRLDSIAQLFDLSVPNESTMVELSKQVILESLADCFLLRNNEELAVRSYVLSVVGCSAHVAPESLDGLFGEQISLRELIFQYYGLAHEIGHCARTRYSIDQAWISERLEASLTEIFARAKLDPQYEEDRVSEVAGRMANFFRSYKGKAGIGEEISADLFAVECLYRIGVQGWLSDYKNLAAFVRDFAQHLCVCINSISLSERLQQFARLAAQSSKPAYTAPDDWFTYSFMSNAASLRATSVFDLLARLIGQSIDYSDSGLAYFPDWNTVLTGAIEGNESLVNRIDEGLTEARRALFEVPDDTFSLITEMNHYHRIDERMGWVTEYFIERVRERIPSSGRYVDPLADTLCN